MNTMVKSDKRKKVDLPSAAGADEWISGRYKYLVSPGWMTTHSDKSSWGVFSSGRGIEVAQNYIRGESGDELIFKYTNVLAQ